MRRSGPSLGTSRRERAALAIGRARGRRLVLRTWDGANGGNLLYQWQAAHLLSSPRSPARVQRIGAMTPWLERFPLLERLTTRSRPHEPGDLVALCTGMKHGIDFTTPENRGFCTELIASSPRFRERLDRAAARISPDTVVVNVRRGDYASVPEHWARYGMDVQQHIREALEILEAPSGGVDALVVSDDPAWCLENLRAVLPRMRTVPQREDMFDDLACLASARRLVAANSTFSYWGAHLAAARIPGAVAVVPAHHETGDDGRPIDWSMDPAWPRTRVRPGV